MADTATTTQPAKQAQPQTQVQRKSRTGVVISNKMTKTVVVVVERRMKHGKYGKYLTERKKYKAHDEKQACKVGDKVVILETRPLSKEKRWRVAEILETEQAAAADAGQKEAQP
jgi:small subunit ribosomal protein S17